MNTKITLLIAFVLFQVASCNDGSVPENIATLNVSDLTIADDGGKAIAVIAKVIQIIAFFMLLADAFCRYKQKPLYFGHAMRFLFFVYGSCCPWLLGGNENYAPKGYRGVMDRMGFHYFDQIYHGYFGFGYINCFNHKLAVDGNQYGFLYINILFFELLGFFLLKTAVWATSDGLKRNEKWPQFLAMFKGMYFEMFAFPFCGWGVFFFKQHFVLVDLEDSGKNVTGRNDVVYWFSMLLALWMNYEVAMSCIEFFTGSRDALNALPQNDMRAAGGKPVPSSARSDVQVTQQSKWTPPPKKTNISKPDCTVDAMYNEFFLQFNHHYKAGHAKLSNYYSTVWCMRWVFFAVSSIVWYRFPRTMYAIFFVLNILMIVWTVTLKNQFRSKLLWILILVEEILIWIWHLGAWINYLDYYGNATMAKFWVNLNTNLMFWPYIATLLIETFILVYMAIVNKNYYSTLPSAVENTTPARDDIQIDIQSKDELENKIETYRTMKESSQRQDGPEDPTENGLPSVGGDQKF